ncbi:conjugal transfer protein, partial [Klebsiella pneumoniae]|uniref:type IV secretion system protein n=2 Tax=Gammaproteobacteria TaxID=1236 RepID=UPI001BE08618
MKLKTLMAVSLAMAISLPVYASGIPTVDVANITQLVVNAQQQAKEALAQLDKAKEAISQAKSQYDHYKSIMQGND